MSNVSYEDYYTSFGFKKNPFRDRTAENEDVRSLFVAPEQYSEMKNAFEEYRTCIVVGNRGTGKTIIIDNLDSLLREKGGRLVTMINTYEGVELYNNILNFYDLILQKITRSLLVYLKQDPKKMRKIKKDDKVLISFLIQKYSDSITDTQLKKEIESIQLSKLQRVINFISTPLTKIANYGGTAAANLGNQFLTSTFGGYIPSVNSNEIKTFFPDIKFTVEDDFHSVTISYDMFNMIVEHISNIVGSPIVVFFDKFDEDSRIDNDLETLVEFLGDLFKDNQLLLNKNLQMVISVWAIAFKGLASSFRKSKHYVYEIQWRHDYLISVLNHRLNVYSDGYIQNWKALFSDEFEDIDSILNLANGNPRDLWDIFDNIMKSQFDIDKESSKISTRAVKDGMNNFVSKFNFYEYYPKKKNSRSTSLDVYSYINMLKAIKDSEGEFSNYELKTAASTGGSTTNYITGMQNIGLVEKTSKKREGGAVIYRILDPKVKYAIANNIDIDR